MGYYIRNIGNKINQFRRATMFNDLTTNELHALLNFFGIHQVPNRGYIDEAVEQFFCAIVDEKNDMLRKVRVYVVVKRWLNGRAPSAAEFDKWYDYAVKTNRSPESIKPLTEMLNSKKIYVTPKQFAKIQEAINEDKINLEIKTKYAIDPAKVKLIVKYLEKAFKRASLEQLGDDGYPKQIPIVTMIGVNGDPLKNMTDVQLFYLLQDRFQHMFDDTKQRDSLLKQLIKDWYYNKISKHGLLSVNMI